MANAEQVRDPNITPEQEINAFWSEVSHNMLADYGFHGEEAPFDADTLRGLGNYWTVDTLDGTFKFNAYIANILLTSTPAIVASNFTESVVKRLSLI